MLRFLLPSCLLVGLVLTGRPAEAQTALDAITSDAAVVIKVKAPKTTTDKVAEFASQILPELGAQIRNQSQAKGVGIHNMTLDGVDQAADWYVAVYTRDEGEQPVSVFVIPATDVKKMKSAVGDDFTFMEHGKFGVYTKDEDIAAKIKDLLAKKGKSISGVIDSSSRGVFEKGDVSLYVNVAGLMTQYKDKIEELQETAKTQLENLPEQPGVDPEQMAKVMELFLDGLIQGLTETDAFTLSVSFAKTGLTVEELVRVKSGSSFDKLLQKSPPNALAAMSSLPQGSQAYLGMSIDMAGLLELSKELVGSIPGDEKQKKAMEEAFAAMSGIKFGSSVAAFNIEAGEDGAGALTAVQISEVTPTDKMKELSRKMIAASGEVEQQGFKQVMKLEKDKEKYGSRSADVVTVTAEPTDDANPVVAEMIGKFYEAAFGEDGMIQRYVYLKDRVVQTMGGDKALMEQTLAAVDKPGTPSKAVDSVRKQLGAKSNLLLLLDLPNMIIGLGQAASAAEAIPEGVLPADLFDDLESPESYVAFSAATEPQGLRMTTVVPIEQIQGIMKIVQTVQAEIQKNQNN